MKITKKQLIDMGYKIVTGNWVIEDLLVKGKAFTIYNEHFDHRDFDVIRYVENGELITESSCNFRMATTIHKLGIDRMMKSEFIVIPNNRIPDWSNYPHKEVYKNPFKVGDIVIWTEEHTSNRDEAWKWGIKQVIAIEENDVRYRNIKGRTGKRSVDSASHFRLANDVERLHYLKSASKATTKIETSKEGYSAGSIVISGCFSIKLVEILDSFKDCDGDTVYKTLDARGRVDIEYHNGSIQLVTKQEEIEKFYAELLKNNLEK